MTAGNGVNIENNVISSKGFEYVGFYSSTNSMISIDIDLVNYDYFTYVSYGGDTQSDIGVFLNQNLTWTTKMGDGTITRSYAYITWGYSASAALYICYDGLKTLVQNGHSGFGYTNGKPNQLTLCGSTSNAEQSYIALYRRKK